MLLYTSIKQGLLIAPFSDHPNSLQKGVQDKELDMQTFLPFLGICNACREPVFYSLDRRGISFAVKGSVTLRGALELCRTAHSLVSRSVLLWVRY